MLAPNVEQSREEARAIQAYADVQRLSRLYQGKAGLPDPLTETDPWGEQYRIQRVDSRRVRVLSTGRNRTSRQSGFDPDDIYSDMSNSPTAPFRNRRINGLSVAFLAAIAP